MIRQEGLAMETVLEKAKIETAEKERHNAMINERYRQLFDAIEDQFSATVDRTYAPTYTPQAPVLEETPIAEQTPLVREYTMQVERPAEGTQVAQPVQQTKAIVKSAPRAVAQYSLTPFAKAAMAVFTLLVVAMLVLIGINSQIMQRQSVRLKNLQEQRQELVAENEEVRRSIEELQSEASIIQRAIEAGLLDR